MLSISPMLMPVQNRPLVIAGDNAMPKDQRKDIVGAAIQGQHQQNMVERYIEASSDQDINAPKPVSVDNVAKVLVHKNIEEYGMRVAPRLHLEA